MTDATGKEAVVSCETGFHLKLLGIEIRVDCLQLIDRERIFLAYETERVDELSA